MDEPRMTGYELELSIVMPCLDEAETVGICVRKAQAFLRENHISGEVLVADNGSVDGSPTIASEGGARVVFAQERGYGSALLAGISEAHGHFVIIGDSDDSYDFSRLGTIVERLRAGDDLVMGNRFQGGILPGAMPPLHRWLGNPLLSGIGRLFFGSPIGDFHCGLRGFRREAILDLSLQTTGMEFASEMVIKATLAGLKLSEVPVTLSPAGRSRSPHLRSWRDGWRHLRFMLLFSPRWLFLYPGLILMVAGTLVGGWLLPGPRAVGSVTFDIHTLLYAGIAILLGFQAVLFSMFSTVFAATEGLLPSNSTLRSYGSRFGLEIGLLVGALLMLGGLIATADALLGWRSVGFGPLDPSKALRVVIPAAIAQALGGQIVLASFFLSILGLRRRRSNLYQ